MNHLNWKRCEFWEVVAYARGRHMNTTLAGVAPPVSEGDEVACVVFEDHSAIAAVATIEGGAAGADSCYVKLSFMIGRP